MGIPVLLLHELGGSSASWREVIPLFAPDRRVIAVDFRCAGRSEKPIGSFELSDIADDIAALLATAGCHRLRGCDRRGAGIARWRIVGDQPSGACAGS